MPLLLQSIPQTLGIVRQLGDEQNLIRLHSKHLLVTRLTALTRFTALDEHSLENMWRG